MIIPVTNLRFTYRPWADHATFSSPLAHATMSDGIAVIEWWTTQFGPDRRIDYNTNGPDH